MDIYEFGEKCKSLNKQYKELFGYIPHHIDYACSREKFIEALHLAIKEQKEISHYLLGCARKEMNGNEGENQ